ncbi:MAG TPA: YdcF family protein [Acetobacteraceae bacterium]|nr:YdcF family protein [Acetobacteraceae bacterium]
MTHGGDIEGPGPMVIGPGGFAMLALSAVLMLLSLGASLLLAFGHVLWIALRTPCSAPPARRIVVLGTLLDKADEPTKFYRARLDRAWALWQQAQTSEIVILGGSTSPGARSEADAGAAYLRAGGVPADRIRTEDRSRHTLENLLQYRERFPSHTADQPLLVTSRFHLARSSLLAAGLGIAHTLCAAEDGRLAVLRDLPRMLNEALLIHWYATGRSFARLTGNKHVAARIS